jgi:hypothetical protein
MHVSCFVGAVARSVSVDQHSAVHLDASGVDLQAVVMKISIGQPAILPICESDLAVRAASG